MNEKSLASDGSGPSSSAPQAREQDAIYQNGKLVARVVEPKVDLNGKQIAFDEIVGSDHLLIPEECEFQNFRIMIQKIGFATRVDKRPGHSGRTLGDCVADILGYREQ